VCVKILHVWSWTASIFWEKTLTILAVTQRICLWSWRRLPGTGSTPGSGLLLGSRALSE
jgi:hypothetical protein